MTKKSDGSATRLLSSVWMICYIIGKKLRCSPRALDDCNTAGAKSKPPRRCVSAPSVAICRRLESRFVAQAMTLVMSFFPSLAMAAVPLSASFVDAPSISNDMPDPVYELQSEIAISARVKLQPDAQQLSRRVAKAALETGSPPETIGYFVPPMGGVPKLSVKGLNWQTRGAYRYAQVEVSADKAFAHMFSISSSSSTKFSVLIRDNANKTIHGGFTISASEPFISPVIEAASALIELSAPSTVDLNGHIQFDAIAFLDFSFGPTSQAITDRADADHAKALPNIGTSLGCQPDASCNVSDVPLAKAMNGVMQLVITRNNNAVGLCTGALMASNIKRPNSSLPYTHIYTALHCLSYPQPDSTLPRSVSAFFFFRSTNCNSGTVSSAYRQVTFSNYVQHPDIPRITSDSFRSAIDFVADQVILSFTEFPPSGAQYLRVSLFSYADTSAAGQGFAVLHHPQGDLLKIAFGNLKEIVHTRDDWFDIPKPTFKVFPGPAGNGFSIRYSSGLTEGGSSGAPLLARQLLSDGTYEYFVAGVLSGDSTATCGAQNTALFNRLDYRLTNSADSFPGGSFLMYKQSFGSVLAVDLAKPYGGFAVLFQNFGQDYRADSIWNIQVSDSKSNSSVVRNINTYRAVGSAAIGKQASDTLNFRLVNVPVYLDWTIQAPDFGPSNDFSIVGRSCDPNVLVQPGSLCSVTIAFHPVQLPSSDPAATKRVALLLARGAFLGSPYAIAIEGNVVAPIENAVIEFVNTADFPNSPGGHFFYSNDLSEIQSIDTGGAGRFVRTGKQFNAGGEKQLCRFYGSVSPGPNSHFFTLIDSECQNLKNMQVVPKPTTVPQWNYEGLTFSQGIPTITVNSALTCPIGTVPVYRYYNNAFRTGVMNPWDSNHRFGTDKVTLDAFSSMYGWSAEGIVFCARP